MHEERKRRGVQCVVVEVRLLSTELLEDPKVRHQRPQRPPEKGDDQESAD